MGDWAGRKKKRRKRDGEVEEGEEEEEEKGSLASSLICKKCITSEIKRKITAPKQNTEQREKEEVGGAGGRRRRQWIGVCVSRQEVGERKEDSPVWISCRIGKNRRRLWIEEMRGYHGSLGVRSWLSTYVYVFLRGNESIHAADCGEMVNEGDDAVLMARSPQGRENL